MRFSRALKIGAVLPFLFLGLQGQEAPSKDPQTDAKGLPAREAPTDYLSHAKAGSLTIAAEFTGHSVPTLQGPLTTEDYIIVEVGLFGSSGARLQLSHTDFSLRINGKKAPMESQPYGLVIKSIKDPEWEPPKPPGESKSGATVGTGGDGSNELGHPPPRPPKVPIELQRAMAQRVQRASLPEGDRPLPQAGLVFFQYGGRTKGVHSIELVYAGPAGKATLKLQPLDH